MPRLATRYEQDARAVLAASLRRRGHTFLEIAEQLELSTSGAHHAARRAVSSSR
jgi:hypothetical protein